MKVIIAGGRDYRFTALDIRLLDRRHAQRPFTEVVCGMARGADTEGRLWAEDQNIPVARFPAHWDTEGRGAGYRRNERMADYADALIAFPGGVGTGHMVDIAYRLNLEVLDLRSRS